MNERAAFALARLERQTLDRMRQEVAAVEGELEAMRTRLDAARQGYAGAVEQAGRNLPLDIAGQVASGQLELQASYSEKIEELINRRNAMADATRQQMIHVKALEIAAERRRSRAEAVRDHRLQMASDELAIQRHMRKHR